jgi:hypothetical protein
MPLKIEFKVEVDDSTVEKISEALPKFESAFARFEKVLPAVLAIDGIGKWFSDLFKKKNDGGKPV